jgi:hypothetical protein
MEGIIGCSMQKKNLGQVDDLSTWVNVSDEAFLMLLCENYEKRWDKWLVEKKGKDATLGKWTNRSMSKAASGKGELQVMPGQGWLSYHDIHVVLGGCR